MRFKSLRVQGLGPFRELVELDLEALDGPLVAVTGRNGAGKSTALELLVGALYRTTPTRGSLRDLATRRDAFVEVELDDGLRIRQLVDPISGKGETLITRGDEVLVESGKVRDGDAWIAKHLPAPEVVFASTFGVQGSGGFVELDRAKRKAVLLRALGLERLEELASAARERARGARARFEVIGARLEEARRAEAGGEELEAALAELEAGAPALEAALEAAQGELDRAKQRGELRVRRLAALQDLEAFRSQRDEVAALVGSKATIEAAVRDRDARLEEARALERQVEAARTRGAEVDGELRLARSRWSDAKSGAKRLDERADALRAEVVRRTRLEEQAESLEELEAGRVRLDRSVEEARAALAAKREAAATSSGRRVGKLREGLVDISERREDGGPRAHAARVLEEDDDRAAEAEGLPATIRALEVQIADLSGELRERSGAVAELRIRLEGLGDLGTQADVEAVREEAAELREAVAAELKSGEELAQRREALRLEAERLTNEATAARAASAELDGLASRAGELSRAEGRLDELARKVTAAAAALEEAEAALEASAAALDVPVAERALADARSAASSAERQRGALEGRREAVRAAAARLVELEASAEPAAAELADWNLLGDSLGRAGLQAALIDAAGPELTALVNDLLHTCVGPRWSVEVRTKRSKASGKGELEVLDLLVVDTVEGREGEVSTFSGGERVILGEAVALALATLARRRAGIEAGATIVRDESGAALDEERAEQWVAMVRRAAELVGASRVLLVTHNPRAAALCDSVLDVSGRTLSPAVAS